MPPFSFILSGEEKFGYKVYIIQSRSPHVSSCADDYLYVTGCNGMVVNMYYVDDVKCSGPIGTGLSLGVALRPNGKICFTISGYQGQGGNTYYLSSTPGHPSYNGSLLVKKEEDNTCLFTIEQL